MSLKLPNNKQKNKGIKLKLFLFHSIIQTLKKNIINLILVWVLVIIGQKIHSFPLTTPHPRLLLSRSFWSAGEKDSYKGNFAIVWDPKERTLNQRLKGTRVGRVYPLIQQRVQDRQIFRGGKIWTQTWRSLRVHGLPILTLLLFGLGALLRWRTGLWLQDV